MRLSIFMTNWKNYNESFEMGPIQYLTVMNFAHFDFTSQYNKFTSY